MLKILGLMFRFSLEDMNLKPADDAYGCLMLTFFFTFLIFFLLI